MSRLRYEGWVGRLAVAAVLFASQGAVAAQHKTVAHKSGAAPASSSRRSAAKNHGAHGNSHGRPVAGKHAAGKSAAKAKAGSAAVRAGKPETRAEVAARTEATLRAIRLHSAFVATTQLRPMAQQLASQRSPASYAGVLAYAEGHPGAGAATAYLALGHAYTLDHRYDEAFSAYRQAAQPDQPLGDYADYLGAQVLIEANRPAEVLPLLDRFADRHPDSIFTVSAPLLLANALLRQKNGAAAVQVLEPMLETPESQHADFRLTLARAYQAAGNNASAARLYRGLYTQLPLSGESAQARDQLVVLGQGPTAAERKVHADQLFNAKRYSEALNEYNALRNDAGLSGGDRDALLIYSAVCDLKLKRLSRRDVDKLPATTDDSAALKLYLYAEISRNEKDRTTHDQVISEMVDKYPRSRWLEEALYSGGNMYLLTHDMPQAIYHYKLLCERFPTSIYAPSSHWREAWMNYRMRRYDVAAALMDEQIVRYPASVEASSALYWRARLYEEVAKDYAQASNYYRALNANYTNFYYGDLARRRLSVIGAQGSAAPSPVLASVRKASVPDLSDVVPQEDPHVIKAKLLANAALNEYIGPEIAASPGSSEWGALAQAQIYASYGEFTRALQSMKHSGISFFSIPTEQVPTGYWKLMFPQPYWSSIVENSAQNNLDPYLVASLIRQESEFNAGAVSPAHAYGLMQLLPSVGKEIAKKQGLRGFQPVELLTPAVNLQLGTRNLRQVLDRFGGQQEYALAAYNAGDVPVRQWLASGDYKDIPEFVESIPYTETREYVQAIMRNRELYRMLYPAK